MFSSIWTSKSCLWLDNCTIVCTDKKKRSRSAIQNLSFQKWCQNIATRSRERARPLTNCFLCRKNESHFVCEAVAECTVKFSWSLKSLSLTPSGQPQKCSQNHFCDTSWHLQRVFAMDEKLQKEFIYWLVN